MIEAKQKSDQIQYLCQILNTLLPTLQFYHILMFFYPEKILKMRNIVIQGFLVIRGGSVIGEILTCEFQKLHHVYLSKNIRMFAGFQWF